MPLSVDFLSLTWLSADFLPKSDGQATSDSVADHSRIEREGVRLELP
jgi:hypothetical protein